MSTPADQRPPTWSSRLRDWWIEQVLRHRYAVLIAGAVLTLVSVLVAARLEIDSDLRALLPTGHPVVTTLEEVEANFGAAGSINVVVRGGSEDARHAFADALAEELADDPLLDGVDHRLRGEFFVEHALYYLEDAEMDELGERIAAWRHYEFCSAAPDVCVEDPDPDAPAALQRFIDEQRERLRRRTGPSDYYEREGVDALVVFLRPIYGSADLDFAAEVVERMRTRVGEVFARAGPWTGTDLRFNLVGPYVNKSAERDIIGRDVLRSGAAALIGVIVVLFVLFRSGRAVLTLLVPLSCGVAWSLAATQMVLGHLNVITSLISSVVMGLGIDAGIHFLTRARRERVHVDTQTSIRRAFEGIIAPLLIASSTTTSAFVVMATSDFPGFGEFGIIAALGVALCLLAMLTVYPALLAVVGLKPAPPLPPGGVSGATRALLARPGLVFVGVVVLTVASFKGVAHMYEDGFERNTRSLQSDETRERTEADTFLISEIFGRDIHPSVLIVDSWDELVRVYELAQTRHRSREELGETHVAELLAAPSLMPPPQRDLEARRVEIAALTEGWSERTWARLEGRAQVGGPEPAGDPSPAGDANSDDDFWADDDEWGEMEPYEGDQEDGSAGEEPGGTTTGGFESPASTGNNDAAAGENGGPAGEEDPAEEDDGAAGENDGAAGENDGAAGENDGAAGENDGAAQEDDPATGSEVDGEPAGDGGDRSDTGLDPADGRQLRTMLEAQPFGPEDLPREALGVLRGADGSWGIFAYPNYDAADIYTGVAFMEETSGYSDGRGIYTGEPTVFATIYTILQHEWPVVIGMAVLIVAAFVFWQVRSLSQTLITLAPLALAFWWTFGILGTFSLKLSLFNVPILPAILGIGVDNGVYLTAAIRSEDRTRTGLHRSVDETGRAIFASMATTAVGFGAFLVADSGGLRTIGSLAVIGIVCAAVAALLAVPTISALIQRHRDRLG